jgi:hypothetical protein
MLTWEYMEMHEDRESSPSFWQISVEHQAGYYRTVDGYLKFSG